MRLIDEFKKFAVKGNMLDMAIGVAIGAAFNNVINSLVADILMPPVGFLMGNVDFSQYYINLSGGAYDSLADAQAEGAATLNYGLFLNNLMNFFLVALALFLIIRWYNRLSRKQDEKTEAAVKSCPYCRMDIPKDATRCPQCTSELKG